MGLGFCCAIPGWGCVVLAGIEGRSIRGVMISHGNNSEAPSPVTKAWEHSHKLPASNGSRPRIQKEGSPEERAFSFKITQKTDETPTSGNFGLLIFRTGRTASKRRKAGRQKRTESDSRPHEVFTRTHIFPPCPPSHLWRAYYFTGLPSRVLYFDYGKKRSFQDASQARMRGRIRETAQGDMA